MNKKPFMKISARHILFLNMYEYIYIYICSLTCIHVVLAFWREKHHTCKQNKV